MPGKTTHALIGMAAMRRSIAFLIALAVGNLVLWRLSRVKQSWKLLATVSSAGYISHLLADARTQRGLPWLS